MSPVMAEGRNNNELMAYVGMEINALLKQGYSPSETKHLVIGDMVENIMQTVAVNDEGEYDYYALMPLWVALKYLVDIDAEKKQADSYVPQVAEDIDKLKIISNYIEHRIAIIKQLKQEEEKSK